MTEAFRQIYWNVGETLGSLTVYGSSLIAMAVLTWGILRDVNRWRKGRPDVRIKDLGARMVEFLVQVFGQKKTLKDRRPGIMHALVFFGFLALFIGTDIIAVEEDFTIPLMGKDAGKILVGEFYKNYELIMDFMGLVFIAGILWMAYRRYTKYPDRLHNRRTDLWALAALGYIGISGYFIEGLRLANQTIGGIPVFTQDWAPRAFVGYGLATVFRGIGLGDGSPVGLGLHLFFWFSHTLVTAAFLASIPFSKLQHIIYTPLNTFFRDLAPKGALTPIPNLEAEIEKDEPRLGVATLADFTWKQRLDFDACMQCGRCQSKCPAYASGSQLSPKFLITKMMNLQRGEPVLLHDGSLGRAHTVLTTDQYNEAPKPVAERQLVYARIDGDRETLPLIEHEIYSENEIWSCTTCRACMEECPAMIEHVDLIVDVRRNLTMIQSEVPSNVKRVLEGIERAGNPWRLPARERTAWTDGLDVPTMAEKESAEVLYWVGCAPAYDERSKRVARAMVQLLTRAGVDFAILGEEESCTGDPARRMGEELLFQAQAQANIETMHQYKFKKIITTCAHCFNTLKNEYPQFGGRAGIDYEVIHHTDLLAQLVREGKLTPKRPINQKVVYHDPCYIGRYNDIYDSPRNVLSAIPGVQLVEAPDWNRERAMCCGGGGGNVWMEGWGKRGVNAIRLEQLMQEKPETLALACPFCMVMFEDAAKNAGVDEQLARKDMAELLLESLE